MNKIIDAARGDAALGYPRRREVCHGNAQQSKGPQGQSNCVVVRPSKLENTVAKYAALLAYFDKRLAADVGLSPHSVEGCEFAIALIDVATDADWEDIGKKAGLKSRPRSTIGLLRFEYERRLRAANQRESGAL